MKKIFKYFASAIALAGFVFVSCSKDDLAPVTPEEDGVKYTLTITASREKAPDTKLLELGGVDNKTLYKKWALNDEVSVYKGETLAGSLRATTVSSDGFDATLTGQLTGTTIVTGDDLVMKFRTPNYSAQNGTLAGIASTCDYAEAEVTVATIDGSGNITTTEDALFKNQQAIVKFTLQDEAANLISATSFTIKGEGMSDIVVTPSAAASELFVAVPGIEEKDLTLTAVVEGETFTCKKSSATLENSKYYGIKVSMFNARHTPLTLVAKGTGNISFFLMDNTSIQPITYRKNNGSSQTISAGSTATVAVTAGDRITFYGNNSFYGHNGFTDNSQISSTVDCYVYGNIMSLVDKDNFASLETLEHADTFSYLFKENTHLYSHSWKEFVLPATTIQSRCYTGLFYGCTKVTKAPVLPATTLASGCYQSMFYGCTALTAAPDLPATSTVTNCYFSMFDGCTSLVSIPATLPGGDLAFCCYKQMFKGCTKIETAPSFAATSVELQSCYGMFLDCTKLKTANISFDLGSEGIMVDGCCLEMFKNCTALTTGPTVINAAVINGSGCYGMFEGCKNLTTFPTTLPAMTVKGSGYNRMFLGCAKMTTAPTLPATTLAGSSYTSMFMNCTSLKNVQSNLPATKIYTYTYEGMFAGCSSLETAPSLSITEMEGNYNCWSMFSNCKKLVNVPDLPNVAVLTQRCYQFMFSGCTSLEKAPLLPSETLAAGSYFKMFNGCTKLNYVKCLATDISASGCTEEWLSGVASEGTFVKDPATTWGTGTSGIPSGWTIEDAS